MICQSEPTRERVKVSHVVVECRVINHHPTKCPLLLGEVNFTIFANRDVGNFVHFWQFFRLSIHILTKINL